MSGHNKWSTIKNKKAKTDAAKGKIFTKIGREIVIAVKAGGSADPAQNSKLKDVIAKDIKDMTGLNVVEMTVNVVDVMTPEEYAQKNGSNSDDGQQDDSAN